MRVKFYDIDTDTMLGEKVQSEFNILPNVGDIVRLDQEGNRPREVVQRIFMMDCGEGYGPEKKQLGTYVDIYMKKIGTTW